jgi:predicted amidohydrolase
LFDTPYFPRIHPNSKSLFATESIPGRTTKVLGDSAKKNKIVLIGGSIFEKSGNKNYNTSVIFDEQGRMLGKYRKVHVPQDEGFYEQDYFASGDKYPVFQTRFGKIGVLICFDQWFPEAARLLRLKGAEIIFYPTAIGNVKGIDQSEGNWQEAWESVQRGHAIANSVAVSAVNRVSREGDTTFWGGSFVYDQFGKLLLRAGRKDGVFVVDCDLSKQDDVESGWGFLRNRHPKSYTGLTK